MISDFEIICIGENIEGLYGIKSAESIPNIYKDWVLYASLGFTALGIILTYSFSGSTINIAESIPIVDLISNVEPISIFIEPQSKASLISNSNIILDLDVQNISIKQILTLSLATNIIINKFPTNIWLVNMFDLIFVKVPVKHFYENLNICSNLIMPPELIYLLGWKYPIGTILTKSQYLYLPLIDNVLLQMKMDPNIKLNYMLKFCTDYDLAKMFYINIKKNIMSDYLLYQSCFHDNDVVNFICDSLIKAFLNDKHKYLHIILDLKR